MVEKYQQELSQWKIRMVKLEQAEVNRLAKENAYAEELYNNHGKPKTYFKVPKLATRVRSNSRRFKKLDDTQKEDKQALKLVDAREKKRAASRSSRFQLEESHWELKQMVTKREQELKQILKDH